MIKRYHQFFITLSELRLLFVTMSSFFSNIFSSKSKKTKTSSTTTGTYQQTQEQAQQLPKSTENSNGDEDLPAVIMPRRYSLSKSGRMKEKKRTKLSVAQNFPDKSDDRGKQDDVNKNSDLPDSEIFDTQGIIKEMNRSKP